MLIPPLTRVLTRESVHPASCPPPPPPTFPHFPAKCDFFPLCADLPFLTCSRGCAGLHFFWVHLRVLTCPVFFVRSGWCSLSDTVSPLFPPPGTYSSLGGLHVRLFLFGLKSGRLQMALVRVLFFAFPFWVELWISVCNLLFVVMFFAVLDPPHVLYRTLVSLCALRSEDHFPARVGLVLTDTLCRVLLWVSQPLRGPRREWRPSVAIFRLVDPPFPCWAPLCRLEHFLHRAAPLKNRPRSATIRGDVHCRLAAWACGLMVSFFPHFPPPSGVSPWISPPIC